MLLVTQKVSLLVVLPVVLRASTLTAVLTSHRDPGTTVVVGLIAFGVRTRYSGSGR
jgi:hypothetical protein